MLADGHEADLDTSFVEKPQRHAEASAKDYDAGSDEEYPAQHNANAVEVDCSHITLPATSSYEPLPSHGSYETIDNDFVVVNGEDNTSKNDSSTHSATSTPKRMSLKRAAAAMIDKGSNIYTYASANPSRTDSTARSASVDVYEEVNPRPYAPEAPRTPYASSPAPSNTVGNTMEVEAEISTEEDLCHSAFPVNTHYSTEIVQVSQLSEVEAEITTTISSEQTLLVGNSLNCVNPQLNYADTSEGRPQHTTTTAFSQLSMYSHAQEVTPCSTNLVTPRRQQRALMSEFDPLAITSPCNITRLSMPLTAASDSAANFATPNSKTQTNLLDFATPVPVARSNAGITLSTHKRQVGASQNYLSHSSAANRISLTPSSKPHLLDMDSSLPMSPLSTVKYTQRDVHILVESARQIITQDMGAQHQIETITLKQMYEQQLQTQYEQHEVAIQKHNEELQSIVNDTNALVTEHEELIQKLKGYEEAVKREQSDKQHMGIVLEDNAKELSRLSNEVMREKARANNQVEEIRKENVRLDFEVQAWESKCAKIKMMLDEREELVVKYAANEQQMMSTIEQLKNDLMSTERVVESIKQQAQEKLKAASVEIAKIRHQHQLANTAYEVKLKRAETQLQDTQLRFDHVQAQLNSKTQYNQELLDICEHALSKIEDQTAEEDVLWAKFVHDQQAHYPNNKINYIPISAAEDTK